MILTLLALIGYVQDRKTIEEVIDFAATEGLILLVEEVSTKDTAQTFRVVLITFYATLHFLGEPGQRLWTGKRVYFL